MIRRRDKVKDREIREKKKVLGERRRKKQKLGRKVEKRIVSEMKILIRN